MRYLILFICLTLSPLFTTFAIGENLEESTTYTEQATGMQFVLIPGGTFVMGNEKEPWAQPVHNVSIQPFYMGKFEVTFGQYDAFCDATGRSKPNDNGWGRTIRPVIFVSWYDANDFAAWLSKKSGRTFRLPTEAEWEYAARGGTIFRFPWGNALGRGNANCRQCGSPLDDKKTSVVGTFSPNQFGLFDMAGNVYEWCQDVWHEDYVGAPSDGSAWMEAEYTFHKTARGGSWRQPPKELTTSARCYYPADRKRQELGIRLVMEP